MLDMTPYLKPHRPPKLTLAELQSRGGLYQGVIASVAIINVANPKKIDPKTLRRAIEQHPVITFEDGMLWIPNFGARKYLDAHLGRDGHEWIGHAVAIYIAAVTKIEAKTGLPNAFPEKRVELLETFEAQREA